MTCRWILQVVVDFHATWCGPCKMISPFFESLQKDFENIVFCKIDVDDVSVSDEEFHTRNSEYKYALTCLFS